jgi:hypothetical protein
METASLLPFILIAFILAAFIVTPCLNHLIAPTVCER